MSKFKRGLWNNIFFSYLKNCFFNILKNKLRCNLTKLFLLNHTYRWQGTINYFLLYFRHSIKTYLIIDWLFGWLMSSKKVSILAHNNNRFKSKLKHVYSGYLLLALGHFPICQFYLVYRILQNDIIKICYQYLLHFYQHTR